MIKLIMMDLKDSFNRNHTYLRISVTGRCNLRCPYCSSVGVQHINQRNILSYEEITRVTSILSKFGIRKVRLTGGEPTIRKDIFSLIHMISAIPGIDEVVMTTNGVLLAQIAGELRISGLDSMNIHLDTLDPGKYHRITGQDAFDKVSAGIDAALGYGFTPLKLNVVIRRGINDDEILDFLLLAKDRPINVRFIEVMPFLPDGSSNQLVPNKEIKHQIEEQYRLEPILGISRYQSVAEEYSIPGFAGTVSFISPITQPFCADCCRLRLTADGCLKPCLLSNNEVEIRSLLRRRASDEEIIEAAYNAIMLKPERGSSILQPARSMMEIGG